ncbi:MAG TPA: R3H domain-containing nucleic acid-binding protein [Chloroflexota bacterium]|nr:R3H domain-containing nucleic acid-binding protein [Chloroflexota bacterium]
MQVEKVRHMHEERAVTDDIDALLDALPPHIRDPIKIMANRSDLVEIIMDLGRPPEARFPGMETILSPHDVTEEDLEYVIEHIGVFGDDNRAGIERTLHRISAIRNRSGKIIGLTCRVGRAVFGTISIIQDIVESGKSILFLGRPGVGKTTMLREVARVLADEFRKRVVIVDTSNEIAGDGDIPHPAIGRSRRMQVVTPSLQHAVMIEAVENHMPEVIVIDEIGTELEATAARTIAERGVQLVGTAHGNTLDNLMMNPTLSDLIGGIQSVTLGDEEARRRGTQKSILERKAPPTFDVVVEIRERTQVALHSNVADVVDSILRGNPMLPEFRSRGEDGQVKVEKGHALRAVSTDQPRGRGRASVPSAMPSRREVSSEGKASRIYPYGISRDRLESLVTSLHLPVSLARDAGSANVVLTVKNYYKKRPAALREAEAAGTPVYVVKSNTDAQIEGALINIFELENADPADYAIQEAEQAVAEVLANAKPVELSPQSAYIRRLQHQLAERYNLTSRSKGREPYRRVKIFRTEQE